MLQSSRIEYHMNTIGIEQSLCTRYSFEHKCMNNIKNIYQHAGKCDNQKNLKDILDDATVLTPQGVTDKSPNMPMTSTQVKKKIARKSLCLFTNILDVKPKTEKRCVVAAKFKHRTMKMVTRKWTHKKTKWAFKNKWAHKRNLYAWITRHPPSCSITHL